MSSVQDHVNAGLALLRADTGLTVYDGRVDGDADHYVVVYTFRARPDGLVAPDKVPLSGASVAVDMRLYCHCVGPNAQSSRAIQGRVEAALLDVTPVVAGRSCSPIRLIDGQQTQRNEETGVLVMDQVDVYGWSSVPG